MVLKNEYIKLLIILTIGSAALATVVSAFNFVFGESGRLAVEGTGVHERTRCFLIRVVQEDQRRIGAVEELRAERASEGSKSSSDKSMTTLVSEIDYEGISNIFGIDPTGVDPLAVAYIDLAYRELWLRCGLNAQALESLQLGFEAIREGLTPEGIKKDAGVFLTGEGELAGKDPFEKLEETGYSILFGEFERKELMRQRDAARRAFIDHAIATYPQGIREDVLLLIGDEALSLDLSAGCGGKPGGIDPKLTGGGTATRYRKVVEDYTQAILDGDFTLAKGYTAENGSFTLDYGIVKPPDRARMISMLSEVKRRIVFDRGNDAEVKLAWFYCNEFLTKRWPVGRKIEFVEVDDGAEKYKVTFLQVNGETASYRFISAGPLSGKRAAILRDSPRVRPLDLGGLL